MARVRLIAMAVFLAYLAWGAYWVGVCAHPVAEECISARLILLATGFPASLISLAFGGVSVYEVGATAFLGAAQWSAVAYLISRWLAKRRANGAPAGT
jgi:hypothetical protein